MGKASTSSQTSSTQTQTDSRRTFGDLKDSVILESGATLEYNNEFGEGAQNVVTDVLEQGKSVIGGIVNYARDTNKLLKERFERQESDIAKTEQLLKITVVGSMIVAGITVINLKKKG